MSGEEPALEDANSQLLHRTDVSRHLLRRRIEPEAALVARIAPVVRDGRDRRDVRRWDQECCAVECTIAEARDDDNEEMLVDEEGVLTNPVLNDAAGIKTARVDSQPANGIRPKVMDE